MTSSAAIAPHLPYLRRFARAVTGSLSGGDAYAMASLEAILSGQAMLDSALDERVALFKVFMKIWASVPVNLEPGEPEPDRITAAADRRLGAMTPLSRVVFLLHAVEGFSIEEIAATLDRPAWEIDALIEEAGREIGARIRTDVLIIEDEPIIALDLEAIVEELGHHVTKIVRTRAEARSVIAGDRPGLVLADVQLADGSGSGLDAVRDIRSRFDVPVVFVTAYPERLGVRERPEPTFLIAKPFQVEAVKVAVSRALFFNPSALASGDTMVN